MDMKSEAQVTMASVKQAQKRGMVLSAEKWVAAFLRAHQEYAPRQFHHCEE